jgi:hypothetical protein
MKDHIIKNECKVNSIVANIVREIKYLSRLENFPDNLKHEVTRWQDNPFWSIKQLVGDINSLKRISKAAKILNDIIVRETRKLEDDPIKLNCGETAFLRQLWTTPEVLLFLLECTSVTLTIDLSYESEKKFDNFVAVVEISDQKDAPKDYLTRKWFMATVIKDCHHIRDYYCEHMRSPKRNLSSKESFLRTRLSKNRSKISITGFEVLKK